MTDYYPPQPSGSNPTPEQGSKKPFETHRPSRKREGIKSVLSTVAVLLFAPLFALVIIAFIFQSYQVDGPSMQTTLFNNDRLIVWKVPRTWAKITHHQYVPKRGDVIVFTDPQLANFGQDPGKQLIKRVIGLPGDHLTIKNNEVTITDKEHPQGFNPDKTLPYGKVIPTTEGDIDLDVPKNEIFVMGDNRPESLDSRMFGTVDTSHIIGKLVLRVWPVGETKRF
jgi:signal peptidase I